MSAQSQISAERERVRLTAIALFMAIVQIAMLGALYSQTAPHPPLAVPPFAIAPMLSASIALCLVLGWLAAQGDKGAVKLIALPVILLALVSYGPQKYLDPAFPQIWIAVVPMQVATVALALMSYRPTARKSAEVASATA